MADIKQIQVGNTSYNISGAAIILEDNGTTTAGTWLAKTSQINSLVDGQIFLYKITKAGANNTTLNITGSGGTALGAKTIYRNATNKLTTHYGVGEYLLLTYNALNTCFRVVNDYDANSTNFVRYDTNTQGLNDTQKSNARTNIGAGTSNFSGSYNDLTDQPTIPTVNNATLTIQKNGTTVKTFTANASSNVTANITVPIKTSDLTNDAGFITGITSSDVTTALGYTPGTSNLTIGTTSTTASVGNHVHGNITNGGDITATGVAIANGDALVIRDSSASKLAKTSITFDGSTTDKFLSKKGTWESSLSKHLHIIRIVSDNATSGYDITFAVWLKTATPYTDHAIDTMIYNIALEYGASSTPKYCLVSVGGYRKTNSTTFASITSGYVRIHTEDDSDYGLLTFTGVQYSSSKLTQYNTYFDEADNPIVTSISDIVVM